MYVPVPFLRALFRTLIAVMLVIGGLIFIIGILIRIVDRLQEKTSDTYSTREKKTEIEIVDDIINYLKNNEGKAFTLNALLKRIYEGNQIKYNVNTVEKLLQLLVSNNEISSQFKDGEVFYLY